MNEVSEFFQGVYGALSSLSAEILVAVIWGTFAAVFVLALILSLATRKFNAASKKPFFALLNIFTGITLAAFLTKDDLAPSVAAAALFWCVGYLLYGALLLTEKQGGAPAPIDPQIVSSMPAKPPESSFRPDVPAAKSNVRLDHAINITDRLLLKNLGRGDRQELEKLRQTLTVLQIKGTLTPAEGDILNDNFNALLKLMAKYNV